MTRSLPALVFCAVAGCTSSSPLVTSSPQVELTTNPGKLAGRLPFELTLTTWNHLAALGDAVTADQLVATLDGASLVIEPGSTGYFDDNDHYVAAFVLPTSSAAATDAITTTSTVTITDQRTTWSFQAANLMANDLHTASAMIAGQPDTVVWPSAANSSLPSTTIAWACVEVDDRTTCENADGTSDPGIMVSQQYIAIDVPANAGDPFVVSGARTVLAQASDDGPEVFVTILDQLSGTFQ